MLRREGGDQGSQESLWPKDMSQREDGGEVQQEFIKAVASLSGISVK